MWNKLTEDSALVLLCDVSELSDDRVREFESVIPAERLRKADAFRFREDRLLSVAASALMIKGIRFFRGDAPSGQKEEPAVFARGIRGPCRRRSRAPHTKRRDLCIQTGTSRRIRRFSQYPPPRKSHTAVGLRIIFRMSSSGGIRLTRYFK